MKFNYADIEMEVPHGIYYPEEDSLLMAKVLRKQDLKDKHVLDMGCGSGFLSILSSGFGATVHACDINDAAINIAKINAKKLKKFAKFFVSDLFENVSGKFDVIIFNPPYLPENEEDAIVGADTRYSGGPRGRDVIAKFLAQCRNFMNDEGKILLLISSVTGEREVRNIIEKCNLKWKVAGEQKVSWEDLVVYEITKG